MFTGIVTEVGAVDQIAHGADLTRITLSAPRTAGGLHVGYSVAVNGVCLTAVDVTPRGFAVEAIPETLSRTSLGALAEGGAVNLERPMPADGRFDGHIVQGHVDGVGTVVDRTPDGESIRFRYRLDPELARYVVEKGSITIDGTSLTVTAASPTSSDPAWFEVALIPHTLAATVLGEHRPGDPVNLEVDVIAKYVERMMGEGS